MRLSRIIMGTGVSLDVPDSTDEKVIEACFARLGAIDRKFSTYKKDSELSRFQRGEISQGGLSDELKFVITSCQQLEKQTKGYFSPRFSGRFDPTGYVKGWAISEASNILEDAKLGTFCLSIGGDINFKSNSNKVWQIGIEKPGDRQAIIGVIKAKNLAVATSGSYLRGQHIINPKTGRQPKFLKSLTVVGPDIVLADVLATAGFAAGSKWLGLISKFDAYEALAITTKDELQMTNGMPKYLKS
jgi:thiamine biosynthesis lipoprotein